MTDLRGRVAVVTGPENDLSGALADALSAAGAEARRPPAGIPAGEHLATLARVDILVTCPPAGPVAPSAELDETALRAYLDTALVETALWCLTAGRRMLASGSGVIVNVTGLSGLGGWPGWLASSAAFGALHSLTHTLAAEWARSGVRVNALVPGATDGVAARLAEPPLARPPEAVVERVPARRLATADDLAAALLYLVDPAASYVSGEILRVDGGWDAWGRLYPAAARK